jgi:hypothetical protein
LQYPVNRKYWTPSNNQPFPKAGKREYPTCQMRERFTLILTDLAVKNALEQDQQKRKSQKHRKKPEKNKNSRNLRKLSASSRSQMRRRPHCVSMKLPAHYLPGISKAKEV